MMAWLFLWGSSNKNEKMTKKPIKRTLLRLLIQILKSGEVSELKFEVKF